LSGEGFREAQDFDGRPTEEPVVLAWMPAASLYFHDPDGNLLEFLAVLEDAAKPERGVVPWSQWTRRNLISDVPPDPKEFLFRLNGRDF
jgi:hypothetical protein